MIGQIILYAIIAMFIGISQSAGIGGGPVLNICLMIGAGYSAKQSMSITYIILMGGAAASIIKNFNKFQQGTRELTVDYDLIMVTLPMSASGSLFGTLTNHLLSQLFITLLFTILLSYLCINTYNKLQQCSKISSTHSLKEQMLDKNVQLQEICDKNTPNTQLDEILAYEQNPLPEDKLKMIGFVFLVTLIVLLIKGGHHFDSIIGLEACGFIGNLLIFVHLGLCFYCARQMALKIIQKDRKKESLGYVFSHESDKMSENKMKLCMISGFCAGMIGGALGLGGAIILVPVWLNLGINQVKATSSSPPLIFFSAVISFTICLLSGRYKNFMQLCFFFCLAYISSAVVKSIITIISQKYKLKTMIFILLLITMASSLVALLPFQLAKLIRDPGTFVKFGDFC